MKTQKTSYTKFTDFLEDERFVHWKLFPTEESNAYWANFIEQNPHLLPLIREAEDHFLTIKIEEDKLTPTEKSQLWQRILQPTRKKVNIGNIRFYTKWSVAVAAVAAVLIIVFTLFVKESPENQLLDAKDRIVGTLLKEKEIQLIVGDNVFSFENNVRLRVTPTGKIQVLQDDKIEKTIEFEPIDNNKLVIPYGKRTKLYLADGSKMWLNSGSILEFPTRFTGKNRDIHLVSGEIYIEVAPNRKNPFRVKSADFTVNVLGTKFNLSSYANHLQSVILVEGKVRLQSENKKEVNLIPGEQAVYTENKDFNTRKVDTSQFISWTKGYLTFDKTPVYEVLQQIERYYNISFQIDGNSSLKDNTCSGKLSLSENIDDIMNTIARLSNTNYTRENHIIYISSKGSVQ